MHSTAAANFFEKHTTNQIQHLRHCQVNVFYNTYTIQYAFVLFFFLLKGEEQNNTGKSLSLTPCHCSLLTSSILFRSATNPKCLLLCGSHVTK